MLFFKVSMLLIPYSDVCSFDYTIFCIQPNTDVGVGGLRDMETFIDDRFSEDACLEIFLQVNIIIIIMVIIFIGLLLQEPCLHMMKHKTSLMSRLKSQMGLSSSLSLVLCCQMTLMIIASTSVLMFFLLMVDL